MTRPAIAVYHKHGCVLCEQTLRALTELGVPHYAVDVEKMNGWERTELNVRLVSADLLPQPDCGVPVVLDSSGPEDVVVGPAAVEEWLKDKRQHILDNPAAHAIDSVDA